MIAPTRAPAEPAAPSPRVIVALDNARYEALERLFDRIGSFAISAAEAAWRGDGKAVWVLSGQLGVTVAAAIKICASLGHGAEADEQ